MEVSMTEKKLLLVVGVVSLVLLVGMTALAGRIGPGSVAGAIEPDENAKVELASTSFDFGQVKMNDGDVKTTFEIKNSGSQALKLFGGTTTCGCTSAYLELDGKRSGIFGMHTKSSAVFEVPSGKTAQLTVTVDPAFHGPSGIGQFEKDAIINTNDPANPQLTFVTTGEIQK